MGIGNVSWLVTGGCGFIGTNLIKYLLEDEPRIKIRVLDNLFVGTRDDLSSVCDFIEVESTDLRPRSSNRGLKSSTVELVVGDICNYEVCHACCTGMDFVIHLAANTGVPQSVENPRSDMESNVAGTFNMLESARLNGVDKFIFASSGAPLGEVTPPIHEELAPHPVSPYGASKLAGEAYCSSYFKTYGLKTVILRFGNVYGPRSKHKGSVVAKFIKQALKGETMEIYGDGNQTRDFIYIDDLIQAIMLATAKDGLGGEIFQIATSKETTVNELLNVLKNVLVQNGLKNPKIVNTSLRQGDVRRNFSDTTKARKMLGWLAKIELEDGIGKTYEWYLSQVPDSI